MAFIRDNNPICPKHKVDIRIDSVCDRCLEEDLINMIMELVEAAEEGHASNDIHIGTYCPETCNLCNTIAKVRGSIPIRD
jgi:hypothetical protein